MDLWYRSADSVDHRRACNLMLQSAYLGSSSAMFELAVMLTKIRSECRLDGVTPRILYERAADAGNVSALLALGDAYNEGRLDLPTNAAEAIQYYRRVTESSEATDDQKEQARKKIEELEKQP